MPSRRLVLRGALTGAAVAGASMLAGCRVRLEDDAPAVPFLERAAIPDEAVLIQTYREALDLAALAARVPGPLAAEVAPQHQRQAAVVLEILTAGGVPSAAIAPPASTPSTTTGPPAPPSAAVTPGPARAPSTAPTAPPTAAPPAADPAALAAAELQALAPSALTTLAATVAHRTLFTAVTAHRAATASLFGATPAWPAAPALPATVGARTLDAARTARYAVQVAAAHLAGAQRELALGAIATLDRRVADLTKAASGVATPPPLGYRLPFPVANADDAVRLLATALGALVAGGLQSAADLPLAAPAYVELVRLHTEAVLLARPWGVALTAFPGLADR